MNRNPFEESARAKKALALLGALDRQTAFAGLPSLSGAQGVETVRMLSTADWRALARDAGVRPPSKTTIALVADAVEARRTVRRATPRPEQLALLGGRKAAS